MALLAFARPASRRIPAHLVRLYEAEDRADAAEIERDKAIRRAERAERIVRDVIREAPVVNNVCEIFAKQVRG